VLSEQSLERWLKAEAMGIVLGVHIASPVSDRRVQDSCVQRAVRLYRVADALKERPLPCKEDCVCYWRPVLRSDRESAL
jgi:hypothetical protein